MLMSWSTTGTPILVPLTPSLYVPGKLASTDAVLVDIGTGFYVEKVCRLTTQVLGGVSELISLHPDTTSCARVLFTESRGAGEEPAGS